ncbi:HdeD family acid-resistance protein [Hoeflea sp. WL0058]|uniref:HdeD family acid-resistance protein n=1 Tax=Flavimaribacter sediminis TaxID=2865987 RepID=A0AAE2ZJ49_9HYPH|nr:HdeD family acid-resistance protein [Flavimaribacter sediminis]MBW8636929.1 HdeD family acid-resistance protein [Flavimaribacter sediminis]
MPDSSKNGADDFIQRLKKAWGWLVLLGVISLVGGILCFANPLKATIAAETLAAIFFILIGILQLAQAFSMQGWGGVLWSAIVGVVSVLVGAILIKNPLEGAATLTAMVGILMFVMGGFKIAYSFSLRSMAGWVWVLVSGILSIVIGIVIFADFPWAAVTVLGLFLGVELTFNGISLLMTGIALRNA